MRRGVFVVVALVTACSLARDLDGFDDDFGKAGDGGTGEGGVPTTGWCARNADAASFCADFDDDAGLTRFDPGLTVGGTVAVDAKGSADGSAPNALVATAPASASEAKVFVTKYGNAGATFATFGADIRIEKLNEKTANAGQPISLYFEDGGPSYSVGITVAGRQRTTSAFELNDPDQASYRTLGAVPSIADGKFHRVDLDVDIGAKRLVVRVDGVATELAALAPRVTKGRAQLVVGLAYANPDHDGWSIRADNVTFFSR